MHPHRLNFTADNWNTPQRVTLRALSDEIAERTVDIVVEHSVLGSEHDASTKTDIGASSFHSTLSKPWGFVSELSSVRVRIFDDDEAGLFVTRISHHHSPPSSKGDAWTRTVFSARMASQPRAPVRLSVTATLAAGEERGGEEDGQKRDVVAVRIDPKDLEFSPRLGLCHRPLP